MRVKRPYVDLVVKDRDTPVHCSTAPPHFFGQSARIPPERPRRSRIERRDAAARLAHIHDAVDHQRCRFDLLGSFNLIRPGKFQPPDIRRRYLIQTRVAVRAVVARVREPVAGF